MAQVQYKDYYKTLGVEKNATAEEIKKAYRKLARQHHPDVNKSATAEKRFKEINEAHEVLSDPEKRKRYDTIGPDWERYASGGGPPPGAGGFQWRYTGPADPFGDAAGDFSDFFRTLFGDVGNGGAGAATDELFGRGRTRRTRSRPGADFEAEVEISLEEAYRGTERTVEVTRPDGDGTRRLDVKIPAGVRDGQRIRLAGQGGAGAGGGPSGDVYLRVQVRPHPFFVRDGDDLRADLPVALHEALLGAEVTVPTLKGRVSLRIPPETQNGRTIRLAGQGMPRGRGPLTRSGARSDASGGFGDLYVTVKVVLPTRLSEKEREGAREFAKNRTTENVRSHLLS